MGASLIVAQSLVESESATTTGTGAYNTVPLIYRACTGECYVQPLGKRAYSNGDMSMFTPCTQTALGGVIKSLRCIHLTSRYERTNCEAHREHDL